MKTMFMFDLLTMKKMLKSQVLLSIVVAVILGVSTGMTLVIIPFMTLMLSYSTGLTLVAYDERNNWEKLRLALPLSRADIVRGRYVTFAATAAAGTVLGGALIGILQLLAQIAPTMPVLSEFSSAINWQTTVTMTVAGVAFSLVLWAVTLPMIARHGMTKTVRFLPLAIIAALPVVVAVLDKIDPLPATLLNLAAMASSPVGTLVAAGIALIVVAALFVLSSMLSVRLYEKREF